MFVLQFNGLTKGNIYCNKYNDNRIHCMKKLEANSGTPHNLKQKKVPGDHAPHFFHQEAFKIGNQESSKRVIFKKTIL